jgi:hypothetical protein
MLFMLSGWGWASLIGLVIAGIAAYAERRRSARTDLERVGIVPWTLVMVMALLLAVVGAGLWLKGW